MSKEQALAYLKENTSRYNRREYGESFDYIEIDDAYEAIEIASQPEWISVSDRLPEKAGAVWAYTENSGLTYFRENGVYDALFCPCDKYPFTFQTNVLKNVTHWQPYCIPEPPQTTKL